MSDVADALVTDHLPLAEFIGSQCHCIPPDDARQEAVIALMVAARKFSPDRGVKFSTFAASVIRNHLFNAAIDYSPLPLPSHQQQDTVERRDDEMCEALRATMEKLMPDVRLALEMRYGEDEATFEEIGARLDCSHVTASAMVAAGLVKLKGMMEARLV